MRNNEKPLKKAALKAAAALTAALVAVSALAGLKQDSAAVPEEPPAIVETVCDEPEKRTPETEKKREKTRRLRFIRLSPLLRKILQLPLTALGALFSTVLRRILSPVLAAVFLAVLPALLILAALKLLFPDVPFKKLLCRKNLAALGVYTVLMILAERVFDDNNAVRIGVRAALSALLFAFAAVKLKKAGYGKPGHENSTVKISELS